MEWKVPPQMRVAVASLARRAWRSARMRSTRRSISAGGPAGEGEQQDPAGIDAGGDQVGHAVGEGVGLAGAGAGDDEQRAGVREGGRLPLLRVELGEVGVIHDRRCGRLRLGM